MYLFVSCFGHGNFTPCCTMSLRCLTDDFHGNPGFPRSAPIVRTLVWLNYTIPLQVGLQDCCKLRTRATCEVNQPPCKTRKRVDHPIGVSLSAFQPFRCMCINRLAVHEVRALQVRMEPKPATKLLNKNVEKVVRTTVTLENAMQIPFLFWNGRVSNTGLPCLPISKFSLLQQLYCALCGVSLSKL
jgi:hypothetical protein